jgi:integrase/recombinase XerD
MITETTETPTIPQALEEHRATFLEALKIRRSSPATIESRNGSLTVFFRYLAGQGIADVRDVSRQTVKDYQLWLLAQDYTPMTVVSRMQAVRRFFEHLEATDVILVNPCAGIPLPRLGKRLPKAVLTEKEAKALLDAPDTQTPAGIRDRAILEVFYSTGIRLEEMARLTIHDVDYKNGFVRVNKGKFAKDRMTPLGRKACDYVREYLQKVRSEWSKSNRDERALWLSSKQPHGPLKSQAIEVMVKQYGRNAGIEKHVTPHVWRHSCATHLVADGANIAYVQRLLGHRSLRTTQIYTRTTIAEIKATHARAHPEARAKAGNGHAYKPAIGKEGEPLVYRKDHHEA